MIDTNLSEVGALDLPIRTSEAFYKQAEQVEKALGASTARGQAAALRTIGDYFGNLPTNHPLIWVMAESFSRTGSDRERFEVVPGGKLDRLMSMHGDGMGVVPPVEITAMEVAAAAAVDAMEFVSSKASEANRARDAAVEQAKAAAERAARADELEVKIAEANNQLGELGLARDELQTSLDFLRKQAGARPTTKPRRQKVEGREGVYFSETAEGTVYSATWTEDGKQRWKTVGPDLQAAIDLRAEMANGKEAANV